MKNKDEITAELQALGAGWITGKGAENVFQVPENYFGQFPGQMMEMIRHMNQDTSWDIAVEKSGPYQVPAPYFAHLSEEIIAKVRAMDHIVHEGGHFWNDPEKKNPFALPQGYFDQFESALLHKIFHQEEEPQQEIESISPLLAGLKRENAFAVPENYFNTDTFSQKTKHQETQVKAMPHPAVKSIKWARWAAAAAVMAIFTLGGFHYLIPSSSNNTDGASFDESLAQIPENRIKDWLSNNMDESDINSLGGSLANVSSITPYSLNNFSDKEIKDYLETEVW